MRNKKCLYNNKKCDWNTKRIGVTSSGDAIWCDWHEGQKVIQDIDTCYAFTHGKRFPNETKAEYTSRINAIKKVNRRANLAIIISLFSLICIVIKLIYDILKNYTQTVHPLVP